MRMTLTNATIAQEVNGRLFAPAGSPVMFPSIARVRPKITDGMSTYHAFRLQVNQRLTRGLQLRGAYTFAKSLDTGSSWAGSADFGNEAGNPRYLIMQDKGYSAFDIRNNLTVNFSYDLPGQNLTGGLHHVLGGWQASGIVTVQDGSPFNVGTGYTPDHWETIEDYPDLVGEVKYDHRNPDRYFDPSAFAIPGQAAYPANPDLPAPENPGYIGNLQRNYLIGPGNYVWNFVLAKRFNITERMNVQFRSEFFNFLNRVNFSTPSTTLFENSRVASTQTGVIDSTDGTAREIQLGLKLEF
jgi:hypothetical protein